MTQIYSKRKAKFERNTPSYEPPVGRHTNCPQSTFTYFLVPPGLLQLTAVRHQRRVTATRAVGPERSGAPGHWYPKV